MKVLLVLDDVNKLEQLEKLAGDKNWFGPGSRIIITTRDQHVLDTHGVERKYEVRGLSHADALQLLSWNAFKKSYPEKWYEKLMDRVVQYAKGLPLVLVVLGSLLYRRSEAEWESTICKLQKSLHKEIYEILKISFDALEDNEKAIFLDIACFFKGENKDFVTEVLEASDFDPIIGTQVLIERSLVNIGYLGQLQMHDVIQLMGKNIVHKESPNEPGKRSRLWSHEDILHVLMENTGTNAIQGIKLDLFGQKDILLNPGAFTEMKRLRLLIIRNARFSEGPKSLSNELRFLDWTGYPSPSLPSNFHPQKLVTLNMCHSKIKQFEGIKLVCENLRKINFSYSEYLTCIPDVSTMANLESLNLNGCGNLVEVHQSLGFLNKLSSLDVNYCSKLGRLPNLKLPLLEFLRLGEGTSIEKFPNILGEIPRLRQIIFYNSPIQELPSSVEYLIGLEFIQIHSCKKLRDLPRSISKLPRLKSLGLWGCTNLGRFPKSSSLSSSTSSGFRSVDMRFSDGFPALEVLIIFNCDLAEVDFLESFHCFPMLQYLVLSGNNFVSIPACMITRFTNLRSLSLEDCEGLRQKNASSGGKSFIDNLTMMMPMVYRFCRKMAIRIKVRGGELPEWFRHQTRENEMCFRMPPPKKAKLAGLVIGIVLQLDANLSPYFDCINIYINGREASSLYPNSAQLDGVVWLFCFPGGDLEGRGETNVGDDFRVSLEFVVRNIIEDGDKFHKRLGVHFLFENTDDDDDLRVIRDYCSNYEKSLPNIEEEEE